MATICVFSMCAQCNALFRSRFTSQFFHCHSSQKNKQFVNSLQYLGTIEETAALVNTVG